MRPSIPTVGTPPDLSGRICEALICEQYFFRERLEAEANVTFLKVAGTWHRLHLEPEVIFWRSGVSEPQPYDVPAEGWSYPHVDVGVLAGVAGSVLVSYDMWSSPSSVGVTFHFANGRRIHFDAPGDRGRYVVE